MLALHSKNPCGTFFGTLVNHIESWPIGPSFKQVFHGYRGGQSLQKKILGDRSLFGEAGGGMLAAWSSSLADGPTATCLSAAGPAAAAGPGARSAASFKAHVPGSNTVATLGIRPAGVSDLGQLDVGQSAIASPRLQA